MTIRSNPPGAHVYVDDYPIGSTPISHNFIYYGQRKIRLVKDGYETLTVMQSIPMPWYQIPPLDFVTENIIPGEIRDHRTITYQLTPQCVVPQDHLLGRAESLRSQVQTPRAMAAPPVPLPPAGSLPPRFPMQPEPIMAPSPSTMPAGTMPPGAIQPGAIQPGAMNPMPAAGQPAPSATYPNSFQPPPVGFGPRSAPPTTQPLPAVQPTNPQPTYPQPGYPQPGYPQPIYTQPGSGGRMVQPIAPGVTGQ